MSETNGTVDRILSLEAARSAKRRKGNDFITVQQCYDMVIQECAKVHEFYLGQIPNHMAQMVQDALLHYQLIAPIVPPAGPTAETPPDPAIAQQVESPPAEPDA